MLASFMRIFWLLLLSPAIVFGAQDPAQVAEARALDKQIQSLPDHPEAKRDVAFQDMVQRIKKEPPKYRLTLASNLAVSAGEVAIENATLLDIANLLIQELSNNNPGNGYDHLALEELAELAFYYHVPVSIHYPGYLTELAKLKDQTRKRAVADFTLTDLDGKSWHLRDLRGKVVLVNFWATWCPPCQREMPGFQKMYSRFANQGFLILAVTTEDATTVKHYLKDHPITFCVLLDTSDVTRKQFVVNGLPHSVLYNREGRIDAQIPGPFTEHQLLDTLRRSGLK